MSISPHAYKNAFILAAGKGTRMRPYTETIPKPMVEVAGKPVLDHILDKLAEAKVENVTINVHHLHTVIVDHLADRRDINITFSIEDELLETGGGVKKALDTMTDDPFYVINGDAFWINDADQGNIFTALADRWNDDAMDILLSIKKVNEMILTKGVGDYTRDNETGALIRLRDQSGEAMFAGIRLCHRRIFDGVTDTAFGFIKLMDAAEEKGRLHGLYHQGDWHHISTPEELHRVRDAAGGVSGAKKAATGN